MSNHHIIQVKVEDELFNGSKDPFLHNEDDFSVEEIIPKILLERKSFLSLTEEGLQKESEGLSFGIDAVDTEDATETSPSDGGEETKENDSSELDQIHDIKMNLSKNINLALNETSLALDLVSLLLSATKPSLAKSTISPHLAKNVPLGSFSSDRLTPEENAPKNDVNVNKIGQGWKYESLSKIKSLFSNKREELQLQGQKEKVYWNQINKVLSNNEILLKMRDPADKSKSIGVKYGYGDSGSSYHDKGIAILRRNPKTGELTFAPVLESNNKLINKTFKYVKVKILSKVDDEYTLTGQSKFEFNFKDDSAGRLITDIEKARFFIFEEDLFFQLTREARTLINYNVSIIADKIIIEVNNEIIEIETISYDETSEDDTDRLYLAANEQSSQNDLKCQLILNYLKIMLCGYFKYNLNLKQKIPTSFTKFKQNNSHPLILRPLIGHFKHEAYVDKLSTLMAEAMEKYKHKLEFEFIVSKYENIKNLTKIETPFIKSIEKPISRFNLIIKNPVNKKCLKVDVDLTTSEIFVNLILHLKIIRYEKVENLNLNEKGTNVLKLTFSDFTEVDQSVDWSIQKFLAE
ncbi:RNA polymerase II mediator complex subunit [Yamadazyma tenuis]|uniref:Mediator of RNA polymerase II transcription subunit 17 n=1 Tax=Candida tenuis (strain ATCC 10573 / BCRC 21748 / CBS 615 / JCM 9827 / NBRC 10315 / NRRL Y-1498 / VKM Y-70) TaxID=590646 RepID=G3AZD6_CANTC|nr:mediator of RNA polymerase II transcription subunit 17 [Yamadazyma tenuis ATCC 10573]EGV66069.1 mediator of RNA polymerase II transcription subunit 17 [Yamadazyma tenuis ATCC 10573]WEJ95583.1 RNA polymerase II mediator complex subunit [Yamadazyma tenuis]